MMNAPPNSLTHTKSPRASIKKGQPDYETRRKIKNALKKEKSMIWKPEIFPYSLPSQSLFLNLMCLDIPRGGNSTISIYILIYPNPGHLYN
jgi:hypothetical protein